MRPANRKYHWTMTQTQLTVSGMTCDHCVRHVTDAISKVTGVQSVNVKLTEGIAVIESDASLDLQVVKDAVVAAGYSA